MQWPSPRREDRAAAAFEDLASALDAGLSVHDLASARSKGAPGTEVSAAGTPGAGSGATNDPIESLLAQGVVLDPIEHQVFEAATRAGELPVALRERAHSRRFMAGLKREVISALAYPVLLSCLSVGVATFVASIGSGATGPLTIALTALVGAAAFVWLIYQAQRSVTAASWLPAPLRNLLVDSSELPYMSGLASLYQAGVPIVESHNSARQSAGMAIVSTRLAAAGARVESGDSSLTEALQACRALDPESLKILLPAEQAGDLEDGLRRAIERRRDVFARRAKVVSKVVGGVAYAIAVGIVAYVVLDFYTSLYSQFGRR